MIYTVRPSGPRETLASLAWWVSTMRDALRRAPASAEATRRDLDAMAARLEDAEAIDDDELLARLLLTDLVPDVQAIMDAILVGGRPQ
jgi:uncharacterized sporulation protein YeaH/YhbH (DUF444 family)